MLPLYILVPLNMYGQYYLVTHVSPGFPVIRTEKDSRWISHNPRSLVAPERWGFYRSPAAGGNAMMNGIPPVVGGGEQQQQMPDRVRRCRKCDGPKPEVCFRNRRGSLHSTQQAAAAASLPSKLTQLSAPTTARSASAACCLWTTTALVSGRRRSLSSACAANISVGAAPRADCVWEPCRVTDVSM